MTENRWRDMTASSLDRFADLPGRQATALEALARRPPPVYLADRSVLVDRVEELRRCLIEAWPEHIIAFSFKTNYGVAREGLLRELGVWAEVVSGREYELARALGHAPEQTIFNGPYKTDAELVRALDEGAMVNLNDVEELERTLELARSGRLPEPCPVGLRVSSNRLGIIRQTRFGLSLDDGEAAEAVRLIAETSALRLDGLHMHLLGDTDEVDIYRRAARALGSFAREQSLDELSYVDMGGGFPASGPKPRSRNRWDPRPISEYVEAIAEELFSFFEGERRPVLVLEPGRYLVGDAVVLVSQVIRARVVDGLQTAVTNGAITMLPLIHYVPQIARSFGPDLEPRDGEMLSTVVYGSSCREDDVLFEGPLAETAVGDLLVHYAAGAYNQNLSPGFIFETPELELF